ncbi:BQ5605_C013g07092 [Microbotryum silenes-dioicae]|uniref:BQ5605_C013g07092 protein n=1 Tax=Microbotryum silenes-dioicae TaxID=796604 RepID=A0A2X0LQW4_9BASI|nr:BQ5605_C013g07092 [Microbotryum silenes-dioicae]
MDQSAFRALLSSSNKPSGTSSGKAASTPRFGAPPPKRSAAATAPALHDPTAPTSSTEFKPRNQKDKSKYKHKQADADEAKSSSASTYRDRAAERRTGARHDFADAEKLLEDFKARVGDDDSLTKDELEEKMKYLVRFTPLCGALSLQELTRSGAGYVQGGDAEHTVLVKGLDMALLERMKAQQAAGADQSLEDVEDELDLVLADKAKKAEEKKKRTRDDLIAELKASKGGSKSDRPAAGGQSVKDPRFKPVGFKPIGQGSETEPKKKKKKKKVKVAEQVATAGDAAASASKVSKPLPIPPPTINVEADDDLDIFGDAGEYKGLDTDSDDDDNHEATAARKEPTFEQTAAPPRNATAAVKRSYFDDDEEKDEDVERSTAPDSVTNLASSKQPAVKMTDSNAIMEEGEEEEEQRPLRLQPLSKSAIPNVKELLAMDAAAEKEEKRKERKQHYQMKAADKKEATLKAMTPQQRAEHEHQVMMTYLEKKERRAKGESTKEDDEDEDVANGGF